MDDDDNTPSDLPLTATVNPFATPAAVTPVAHSQTYFSASHSTGPAAVTEAAYADSPATASANPAESNTTAPSLTSGLSSSVETGFSSAPAMAYTGLASSSGADARLAKASELSADLRALEREAVLVEVDNGPATEDLEASTVRLPPAYDQSWSGR